MLGLVDGFTVYWTYESLGLARAHDAEIRFRSVMRVGMHIGIHVNLDIWVHLEEYHNVVRSSRTIVNGKKLMGDYGEMSVIKTRRVSRKMKTELRAHVTAA